LLAVDGFADIGHNRCVPGKHISVAGDVDHRLILHFKNVPALGGIGQFEDIRLTVSGKVKILIPLTWHLFGKNLKAE
jgi:hypothetical protein